MWARLREWATRPWVVAVVIGVAAVIYAVPLHMLNPLDATWMNRDDTLAHWLGWEQFRHSPLWQLPLGKSELYGLERSTSVVFSDSIPLVALLLHPFEALLPTPFQYLGLWTLLCFILQAYFGYRLCSLLMRPPAALAATIFFAMSSPMLNRIHVHTSLLSHWLILAGLYCYFTHTEWRWRRWALLIAAASLIHGYLFAMTTILWLAHLGKLAAMGKLRGGPRVVLAAMARAALVVLGVGVVMYLAGYFGVKSVNHHLYGFARYDLLNPICSYNIWSMSVMPVRCGPRAYDYDGQGFLGLGMLALLAVALLATAITWIARRRRPDWSARVPRWPLAVGLFLLIVFAATNQVVAGGVELFQYPLSRRWLAFAETFRGSGRMSWPFFYALMLAILALFARAVPARLQVLLLLPLALYQGYDYRVGIEVINADLSWANRLSPMSSPAWDKLASYDRLVSVPSMVAQRGWHDLVWQAAQRGAGTNIGYFNRNDRLRDLDARTRRIRELIDGALDPRTVYVLPYDGLWELMHTRKGPQDVMLVADGQRLLFPGGARLGLVDDPFTAAPALPLGQWRSFGGDADRYLTYEWTLAHASERWSDLSIAGLAIQLPPEAIGQEHRVAIHVKTVNKQQRYRILLAGQLLAEGALDQDGGTISFLVPAALAQRSPLELELELPDAIRMTPEGHYLGLLLERIWVAARPGDEPPPPPAPAAPPPLPGQAPPASPPPAAPAP